MKFFFNGKTATLKFNIASKILSEMVAWKSIRLPIEAKAHFAVGNMSHLSIGLADAAFIKGSTPLL